MPKKTGFPVLTLQEGKSIYRIIKKKLTFPSYIAGSIKRNSSKIYDIDIVIIPNKDLDDIVNNLFVKIIRYGDQIISGVYMYHNIPVMVDFFITTKESLPYCLLQYTGPKSYIIRIRRYVRDTYGYTLNQHGLYYISNGKKVRGTSNIKTEKDLIKFIDTTYYAPEDRQ